MLEAIKQFLMMGGYAFYVWSAYGCVLVFLAMQWLNAKRQWKKLLRGLNHESIS